ncbi:predicted protein [Naegleria gruberi]|uniref:Predicted protein n=1 Tax=Naegleria gruberi TaxID=5762 RepID=D2VU21_NAEGR|nr:uncharacterized protein NAEGRDRAFT_72510 [Naegleria gruberi]EFC39757.1 predicted protein [Naegleria gruberi]|eukprot:XP_002672501.1 predicted protein [Naegleria gruberi strain NEG-M]
MIEADILPSSSGNNHWYNSFQKCTKSESNIEQRQLSMTKDDMYHVKLFRITAPIPLLKEQKLEIIDVPDIFDIVGKVFSHHSAQRSPKMFVYTYGGKYTSMKNASIEFLNSLSEKEVTEKEIEFSQLLEDYFDYKFDDVPFDKSNRVSEIIGKVEFVEPKVQVLEFLKDNFMLYPIPNLDSKNHSNELKLTKRYFKLTIIRDKLIKATRLVEEISRTAILCLPKLISSSKYQSKKLDEFNSYLVNLKTNNYSKKEKAGKIDKWLGDNFLTEELEFNSESKAHNSILKHLKLLEDNIRTLAETYFVSESSGNDCEDYKGFKAMVLPMFDVESGDHVILATETKGVLKELLGTYLNSISSNKYEPNFNQHYAHLHLFETNSKKSLSLPTKSSYSDIDEMKQAKLFNNRDDVNNCFRHDKTMAKIIAECENIKNILTSQDKNRWISDISPFLENLKIVDNEINLRKKQTSNLESTFKSSFFSMNKGRVSCYDGRDTKSYGDKIYSREGFNYMISNGVSGVETFYLPSMKDILPIPDNLIMKKYDESNQDFNLKTLMLKFRCNMLSNGVGGFFHVGFKFKKKIQRKRCRRTSKRKTNSSSSSTINKKRK